MGFLRIWIDGAQSGMLENVPRLASPRHRDRRKRRRFAPDRRGHHARLRDGELPCFDILLQKYRKPIIHFMYRMVHNQAVAEELAQEVFLASTVPRNLPAEARFSTWLYRIATTSASTTRDNRHERTASTIYLDEPDSETGSTPDVADAGPAPRPASSSGAPQRHQGLRDGAPERQRMAVLMHKYEEMDYKQIGEVLNSVSPPPSRCLPRLPDAAREAKGFV